MDRRLTEIFNKVKNKEITFLYDRTINYEDLFVRDEAGVTLLEYALDNKITIDSDFRKSFGTMPEVVLMYIKRGEYLSFLNVTEQTLFTEIEGKLIIEYVFEKRLQYGINLDEIVMHKEILDFLIEHNELYSIKKLNPVLIEDLFSLEPDGTFKIEKYIENEEVFSYLVEATNNPLIIGVCKKHNKTKLLANVNVNLLMKHNSDGKTYLETLNSEGIKLDRLENVPNDVDFVRFLIDLKMYDKLAGIEEDLMFIKINENQTVLEYLIEKNLIKRLNFKVCTVTTMQMLKKYDRYDLIDSINNSLLKKNVSEIFPDFVGVDQPLYQYMIENGYKKIFPPYSDKDLDVIKYLCKNKHHDLLVENTYESFMDEIEPGVLLIDYIVDNGIKPDVNYRTIDDNVYEHLFNKGRLDYLTLLPFSKLVVLSSDGKTYFEHILDAIRDRKITANINQMVTREYDKAKRAELYIMVTKAGLLNHLERVTDKVLLAKDNGKTFLEYLLDVDPDVTVNKIIRKDDITNMEIVFILKERGIDTPGYDTPLINESGYNLDYLNKEQSELGIGPMLEDGGALLDRLYNMFINDGKSDKDLVEALIAAYRDALITNYDITICELANLVKVKEENINKFFYLKTDDGACFRPIDGCVYCEDKIITTILHETGHALHHYLTETKVPDNYSEVLMSARNNVVNLRAVEEFANEYHEICNNIKRDVEERYQAYFESYYNEDRRKEIEEFLNGSKESKREEYKKLGVSDSVIDIIINKAFTVEEYIEHQKRVFIEEYVEAILRSEHNVMMVIGDILDAIFGGQLHSRELLNEEGNKIKGTCGHGIAYYGSYSHGFDEMVANFGTLLKSRTSFEDLKLLRELVGEEVFTMISDFYYTNISKSEPLDLSESISL